jgi:hypothetical protein
MLKYIKRTRVDKEDGSENESKLSRDVKTYFKVSSKEKSLGSTVPGDRRCNGNLNVDSAALW